MIGIDADKRSSFAELRGNRKCMTRAAECRIDYAIVRLYRQQFCRFM